MFLSVFERRRIVVVLAITIIAWFMYRATTSDPQTIQTAVATTVTTTTTPGSLEAIILGGPAPIVQNDSAQVAYPSSEILGVQALSSFSNFDNAPDIVCYFPQAPLGITLTVQNLNNGRVAKCTNVFRLTLPSGATMLLHTKVFQSLANLVDAPIPVMVSW